MFPQQLNLAGMITNAGQVDGKLGQTTDLPLRKNPFIDAAAKQHHLYYYRRRWSPLKNRVSLASPIHSSPDREFAGSLIRIWEERLRSKFPTSDSPRRDWKWSESRNHLKILSSHLSASAFYNEQGDLRTCVEQLCNLRVCTSTCFHPRHKFRSTE